MYMSHHDGKAGMICGCCHKWPCCCHGLLWGAAKKTLQMGIGLAAALKWAKHCPPGDWSWCRIPCDTGIVVHALPDERRIVPFVVKNDTQCPVTVTPEIDAWGECGCGEGTREGPRAVLVPAGPAEIQPCGAHSFDIVIETKGLKPCHCYCASLRLKGTCCEPVVVALCIGGKLPAVCHHDSSRLRSWVRTCCFGPGGPQYIAPPPLVLSACSHPVCR